MNILITGNLSSLATTFATEFVKQKHRVVLASENATDYGLKLDNTTVHRVNPAGDVFREAMSSYGFDIVVFISTREEQLHSDVDHHTGQQLDALRSTLELARCSNVKRVFCISSTEVYGESESRLESAEPIPASINGHVLVTGEQYCRYYQDTFGINITILRLPYVYGPNEQDGYLYRLIQGCKSQSTVRIPGRADDLCNLLHLHDIVDFLKRAIDEEYSSASLVVNLASSMTLTSQQVADTLSRRFPHVDFRFEEGTRIFTRSAEVSAAKRLFDWIDLHDLPTELENELQLVNAPPVANHALLAGLRNRFPSYVELLRPVELILGAVVTQMLSGLTGTLIQYKYVDFRLFFVVLMASVYGLRYGLLAAILMSLSLVYTWYQLQIDWSLLIFNVGNWFPPVLYFVTGLILGYSRDRNETMLDNETNQTKLIYEKYQFLYEVFNEVRALKDEFREQVIGYRDSFGKIYSITRELDTLQEQDVFLKALSILEELMENDSIAIYRLEPDLDYARLEVNSRALHNKLAKSLKLADYPDAVQSIQEGSIFQNTSLLPHYPAYLAPIFNNSYPFNVPVAIIVIWSVDFERYTTYNFNLFKVICGLIQASLVRATKFLDANYERMYIPATRILRPSAFNDVLRTRAEMNKNKVAINQLVMVDRAEIPLEELYFTISEGIRAGDIVGMGADGNCYILLSQADKLAATQVLRRLEKLGLHANLLEGQETIMNQLSLVFLVANPN